MERGSRNVGSRLQDLRPQLCHRFLSVTPRSATRARFICFSHFLRSPSSSSLFLESAVAAAQRKTSVGATIGCAMPGYKEMQEMKQSSSSSSCLHGNGVVLLPSFVLRIISSYTSLFAPFHVA